ncbi:MAG: Regulator of chromosome condensation RCC1 [Candidatus Wolfebacteria bacterium GW2011_GWB2_46_69]|nr:MAG: Regulator of chromosome condensation RCC1 [Candidatus Wolfebacteria bacterium GW2011_GWB2_46_69]
MTQVATGYAHTCAVVSGSLQCWGYDSYGQVGNGATTGNVVSPFQVIASGVTQVAAGYEHTCAVVSGSLQCWGYDNYGQLGNGGTTGAITSPVTVIASGVAQVAAGTKHTCAVKTDGSLQCWGSDGAGQVGNGPATNYDMIAPVTAIASGVTQVAAGDNHTCAVVSGSLQCWGYDGWGQVGNGGTTGNITSPATVVASGVTKVATGKNHTCAVKTDGSLQCWGDDSLGQIGNGATTGAIHSPATVVASGVTQVATGYNHTCSYIDGSLWCWGDDGAGQVGNGATTGSVTAPIQPTATVDTVFVPGILVSYATSGTYTSYFDAGSAAAYTWNSFAYAGQYPSGTTFSIKVKGTTSASAPSFASGTCDSGTVSANGSITLNTTCAPSNSRYLWYQATLANGGNTAVTPSLDSVTGSVTFPGSYHPSGSFTSGVLDAGSAVANWGNLSWTNSGGQTVSMQVRTSNAADLSDAASFGTASTNTGISLSTLGAVVGHRYIQYKATLSTANTSQSPSLDDVSITYARYASTSSLLSSLYNSTSATNIMTGLSWKEDTTLPANTSVTVSLRTGASTDTLGIWTAFTNACGKITDTVTCGSSSIPASMQDGSGDQYFQYKVDLTSDGIYTPRVDDVTPTYTYNVPPTIASITAAQLASSTDANFGKIKIDFALRDTDSTTNQVIPSFEWYDGSLWATLPINQLTDAAGVAFGSPIAVGTGTDTSYSAYWDATQYAGAVSGSAFAIRFTADDADTFSNTASLTSANFAIDTIAPSGTIAINSGASYASSTAVTLNLSATDTGSSVASMRFSDNDTDWSAWESYATSKAYTLATGEGLKTVYSQFRDARNNMSVSANANILIDTIAPVISLVINDNNAFANSITVTLTVTATDAGSGASQMRTSTDEGATWSTWSAFATTSSVTIPSVDGIQGVSAQVIDGSGLISETASDTITLDTQEPTGTLVINDGSAYATSTDVVLHLSATDNNSVTQMQFSGDGTTWTSAESYATTKAYALTAGDATKTVSVRYIDIAGNLSASIDASLYLDTSAPALTESSVVINGSSATVQAASANVTVTLADVTGSPVGELIIAQLSHDGVTWYAANADGTIGAQDAYGTSFSSTSTVAWDIVLGEKTETISVRIMDTLGHGPATDSNTVSYNSAPIVTVTAAQTPDPNNADVTIEYTIADLDNIAATPSFAYSLDGESTWIPASLVTGDIASTTVSATPASFTAHWDAKTELNNVSQDDVRIRVTANDAEQLNNLGIATSTSFILDITPPTLSGGSLLINDSSEIVVTDSKDVTLRLVSLSGHPINEQIQAQFSRNGGTTWYGYVGGVATEDSWGDAFASDGVTLATTTFPWHVDSRSETITVRIRDVFGNIDEATDTNSAGYNIRPAFSSQSASVISDSTDARYGQVHVNYTILDEDTAEGVTIPGRIEPSFAYSTDNGSTWTDIATSSPSLVLESGTNGLQPIGATATVLGAYWDAKADIDGVYSNTAMIRITINDQEAIFSTATATTSAFVIDTTDPTITTARFDARTNALTFAFSDEGAFQYRFSEFANFTASSSSATNATDGQWIDANATAASSLTWTVATSSYPTIYVQVRDGSGNISQQSIVAPSAPSRIDFTDISKADLQLYKEFISWPVHGNVANSTFKHYLVERAADGITFDLLATQTTLLQAYYLDNEVASSTEYTYRIAVVDTDDDTSAYSPVLTDVPDGRGSSDSNAPLFTVAPSAPVVHSTWATITWETDEDADGIVSYNKVGDAAYGMTATEQGAGQTHSVTLSALVPDSDYVFKVASKDSNLNEGIDDNSGAGYTFHTTAGPYITQITGEGITDANALVSWHTNKTADTLVRYAVSQSFNGYKEVWGTSLPVGDASTTEDFIHTVPVTGLAAGTTYYYSVQSTDVQGNTTMDDNGGTYRTFRTTNDTFPPAISQVSTPIRTPNSVSVFWKTSEPATSQVRYGASSSTMNTYTPADATLSVYHSVNIGLDAGTALTPNTTYAFSVESRDGSGNAAVSTSTTFATTQEGEVRVVTIGGGASQSTPPEVKDTTAPTISNITIATTTAFGAIIEFDASEPSLGFLHYGKDAFTDTISHRDWTTHHKFTITGLKMGTEYKFEAEAIDKSANRMISESQTFKTKYLTQASPGLRTVEDVKQYEEEVEQTIESILPGVLPPFVEEPRITAITENTADISWKTNIKSYAVILYAKESEFDATRPNPYVGEISRTESKETDHQLTLVGLEPNTKYHFMVRSFSLPQVVGSSQDTTFTTKASRISARVINIKNTSFNVVWSTEDTASTIVEYKNVRTGEIQRKIENTLVKEHEILIDKLVPATAYEVTVFGYNEKGNLIEGGAPLTVSTVRDITAPKISNFKVDGALVPGRNDRVQTVITWVTDELSNSVIYYQEGAGQVKDGFANKEEQLDTYTNNHAIILSSLKPGTIYQMKIESTDSAGNKTTFGPRTVITPQKGESIFDVIFKNFEDTFKFLRGAGQ